MKDIFAAFVYFVKHLSRHTKLVHEHSVDRYLLFALLSLSLFGLIMVYNTSIAISLRDFGNSYHFIRDQFMWFIIGLGALFMTSRIHYKFWYTASVPILVGTLGLLIAVFFPVIGVRVLGASRWINLGFTTLQPAEFAKLAVVLYLAAWLSKKEKERFTAFLLFLGGTVGLVLLQPDMGTSIVLLITSLSVYLVSGAPLKQIAGLFPILAIGLVLLAVAAPYRLQRITTFLQPDSDPYGSSYQIRQALLGIGSGGITGVGLGKSRQKYEYLPEANTDAIFAIIAEELGFIGSTCVILLFFFIIWRSFRIARRTPDLFSRLIAVGIIVWFGFQSVINIGATISFFPLTGVPLPLVSYGGSSLVILFSAFGILLNISRHQKL